MLHRLEDGDEFDVKLQLAQLAYVCTSEKAAASLAENYVGLSTSSRGLHRCSQSGSKATADS